MGDRVASERRIAAGPAAELSAAVAFLTRVPVPAVADAHARTGAAAFGVVGAVLGLISAIPLVLLGGRQAALAALLALVILAVIDGALHLDGLADTVDALAAPPARAEEARRDPRVGAAGVVGIVLVLGMDAAALAALAARSALVAATAFVVAVTIARAAAPGWALVTSRIAGPARRGLGSWFAASTTPAEAALALLTALAAVVAATVAAGPSLAIGAIAGAGAAVLLGVAIVTARHGLDGDGYGAVIELTVATILIATAILG